MKKTTYILVIVVLLLSAGCRPGSKAGQHSSGERVLTVTIEPQRFFLEKIVGDRFTVNTLIPPGANHETY
ncbi:MAG TPA: zinc ABC transporter substrate-binding protein, partial [Porphyromonadaceae bacterium]|nr:zinc ABC transporter substrate-binding protein [Porphyromonadaceae bacterium]